MSLHNNFLNCLKCFIFLAIVHEINSEYYSSVVGLEKLIEMEEKFVTAVENYISQVHNRRKIIEKFLDKIELKHKKIQNDSSYFLQPVKAFKIIKRFAIDWKNFDEIIDMSREVSELNRYIFHLESNYNQPTVQDLQGAALGLLRLQNVYKLDTKDIASGYILDHKYSGNLKAHDCYIMATNIFHANEFLRATEWFIQALHQLDDALREAEYPFLSKLDILSYLPTALYGSGNFKLANIMNKQLLHLSPENKFSLENGKLLKEDAIKERRLKKFKKQIETSELETLYSQVCSGKLTRTAAEMRLLRCSYVTNNVPYYFIGPLKMEKLNHDPFVAFYHQTIYDHEIARILKEANNKVVRARIGNAMISEMRISKEMQLHWKKHKFMQKIYKRLEDITGLSLTIAEPFQVINYGIGGHYFPHYDFSQNRSIKPNLDSNRILTAMFYISDVELGGATAFPFLRLAVPPTKYSLLVWYNMHESSELDYRTKHAGCPVLKGSKWICNQWFHDVGQEFKRPCGLEMVGDKYNYLKKVN